jgi:hypothetical protein
MTGVVRDWRVELVEAYPDLFHPSGDPPSAQGWPCVGDGWRDLLQRACARIRAVVQTDGGSFKAAQLKGKYATLRFYWTGTLSLESAARVGEAIELAEARSACTRETCGEPGRLFKRGGWFMTACDEHGKGESVEIRPGLQNVHIVERIVGKRREVTCRRYDRVTDSFIEVDAGTLGIEEE